jgi:hypothetical protein
MTTTPRRPPAPPDAARRRRAHLSRLGAGLVVVGGAGVAHTLWGLAVDLPLLVVGAAGLLWALATRRPAHLLAAIVLVAVALFALLDDHGVFTGLEPVMHFGPGAVCSGHDNPENRTQAVSE